MRTHLNIIILLVCALFCLSLPTLGKEIDSYNHYYHIPPRANAIQDRRVLDIIEDKDGYLWIATDRGLFRYNGSIYKTYYSISSNSLSSDFVLTLCLDKQDRLWVGTDSGINLIENGVVTRTAEPYQNFIFHFIDVSESTLLYSGSDGISEYDKNTGISRMVIRNDDLANCTNMTLFEGKYWFISNYSHKLYCYDGQYNETCPPDASRRFVSMEVWNEELYLCTETGLLRYSALGDPIPLQPSLNVLKGKHSVIARYDKYRDVLLVGVRDEGFYTYDGETDRLTRLWDAETLEGSIQAKIVPARDCFFVSNNLSPLKTYYEERPSHVKSIDGIGVGETLRNILSSPVPGNVTIVTSMGIYHFDVFSGSTTDISPSLFNTGRQITASFIDSRGRLYLCDNHLLLTSYSWENGRYKLLSEISIQEELYDLWEDYDGNICSIRDNRLWTLNDKPSCVEMDAPVGGFSTLGNDGNIYLFGYEGVFRKDKEKGILKLPIDIPFASCLFAQFNGTLWIGTIENGLFRYDSQTGETKNFNTLNGLPDRTIRNIVWDGYNVWATTRNNVIKVTKDGHSFTILNFSDEIPMVYAARCNYFSIDEWRGSRLLLGCGQHVTVIDPMAESITKDIPLSLDAVFVNGDVLQSIPDILDLAYDENMLLMYFSGMNFNPGQQLNYSYMMEGYDNDWVFSGQNTSASYSNLPKGKYIFKVRVQNNDGTWNSNILSQNIIIHPSLWLSGYAKAVYVLLGLLLVGMIFYFLFKLQFARDKADLAEKEKKLSEKFHQERTKFLANVSHEFRTPLSLIYGPAKELETSDELGERHHELAALIAANAERIKVLSTSLLNFDKQVSSEKNLSVREVDISRIIHSVASNLSWLSNEKKVEMEISTPDSLFAWCDYEKVVRVLTNLVSNAVKYTPQNGFIRITACRQSSEHVSKLYGINTYEGDFVELAVKDTGIGVSPEKAGRIFARYERICNAMDEGKQPEGFGVGLNYALYLARLHRGELRFTPNKPQGSCFYFVFPCDEDAFGPEEIVASRLDIPDNTSTLPEIPTTPEKSDATILVVEDNTDVRIYIESVLGEHFNVYSVSNGVEAMDSILDMAPALIVSDIVMPYKNGFELCSEIKNNDTLCHIPVILLTAKEDAESMMTGLSIGADAYLDKPFDPRVLCLTVYNILENRKRLQKKLHEPSPEQSIETDSLNEKDRKFLSKVLSIIEQRCGDEEFSVTDIAVSLNMSYTNFYTKAKALLGEAPRDYIANYRLYKAMSLLKTGEYRVSEVGYMVGFNSLTSFSRSFKNKFGIPPSAV